MAKGTRNPMKVRLDILHTVRKIRIIPKRVHRTSLFLKCGLALVMGGILSDSLNSLYYHHLAMEAKEFIVRPTYAVLGLAMTFFTIIFVLFIKTRWDKE